MAAKWLITILLAVIAALLLVEVGSTYSAADSPTAAASGSVFALAGQLSRDTYGVYLVDVENSTICVYEFARTAKGGKLRLMASRTTAFDRRLDAYNTEPPPKEIRSLVEKHQRLTDKE